ncbi:protein of unknown function DUF448 [Thalassoporum mexicanum PCC 7367]|uniref:YlxR family protein n=1 Tax=Thalassoporum mexicanum TaxID=3457544 RepID=UPI00029FDE10|nr:YlxR family protein [Pseudanabaena sp. PCC 7367]AFY70620.1 protein of unknown function DUF448 [Pseudanabaena sp. PCC 7367]
MAPKDYRRCISCRRLDHRDHFWRVVRSRDSSGQISVQLDQGMGRSAYICRNADCLKQAQKKNRLARVLRAPVEPTIYERLQARLVAEQAK